MDKMNKLYNTLIIIFIIILIVSIIWSSAFIRKSSDLIQKYYKTSLIITFSASWFITIITGLKRKYQIKDNKYLRFLLISSVIWILGIISILSW